MFGKAFKEPVEVRGIFKTQVIGYFLNGIICMKK
jgi:hypothetical protein